ncbi:hypothetical protein G7Y79_00082g100770 [Physcia stellaris]|nr:hypothetical protein G7Y79_00082g100770 [Physcia stellaris]
MAAATPILTRSYSHTLVSSDNLFTQQKLIMQHLSNRLTILFLKHSVNDVTTATVVQDHALVEVKTFRQSGRWATISMCFGDCDFAFATDCKEQALVSELVQLLEQLDVKSIGELESAGHTQDLTLVTPGQVVDTGILRAEEPVAEERLVETKAIKKELASQVVAVA